VASISSGRATGIITVLLCAEDPLRGLHEEQTSVAVRAHNYDPREDATFDRNVGESCSRRRKEHPAQPQGRRARARTTCSDVAAAAAKRIRPANHGCSRDHRPSQQGHDVPAVVVEGRVGNHCVHRSMRQAAVPPDTGTLRGDLLQIGPLVCQQASTIRAVLVEASRNSGLNDVLQHEFLGRWKAVMQCILKQAVDRGEIENDAIDVDPWDVLPGYLVFRSIIPHGSPTRKTVQALVDNVIIPSLTRPTA
jgi:Tetracyclin repressor-like, C-terminal domain